MMMTTVFSTIAKWVLIILAIIMVIVICFRLTSACILDLPLLISQLLLTAILAWVLTENITGRGQFVVISVVLPLLLIGLIWLIYCPIGTSVSEPIVANASTDTPEATMLATERQTITASPTVNETITSEAYYAAMQLAKSFDGTANSDWTRYIHDFGDGIDMVLVPLGCFVMGSTDTDVQYAIDQLSAQFDWLKDEQPARRYCIPKPFWIDITEVAQSDFNRLGGTKANPNGFLGDQLPVDTISWAEAQEYCERQNKRLPTEAEWEYAVRGVESLIFPWGNEFEGSHANYCDENCTLDWRDITFNDGYPYTSPVGSFHNGISWVGAFDMLGNVWEWTSSLYIDYPYDTNDGRENLEDSTTPRVLRGASWGDSNADLRASNRDIDGDTGFRCVRDIEN